MHHIYRNNGIYFITFRLADSLPHSKIIELKEEYRNKIEGVIETNQIIRQEIIDEIVIDIYGKYEHQLDSENYGSCTLKDENVAGILSENILSYHNTLYSLKCFSIMPNHVHILVGSIGNTPEDKEDDVSKWINLIKGGSSRFINQYLGSSGVFWAEGFWDRYIRNEFHYSNSFYYTINNPLKAGLDKRFSKKPFMWRKDFDE